MWKLSVIVPCLLLFTDLVPAQTTHVSDVVPEIQDVKDDLLGLFGSGISVWGNSNRVQTKIQQLVEGVESHIYYIGGSITTCHAATPENCWVSRMQHWFTSTFPGVSTHHNAARPGTESIFAASCIDLLVGQNADIVFVEYTANDMARFKGSMDVMDNDARRGFETVLRKLHQYEKAPAIVIVHTWAPLVADEWVEEVPHNYFHTTPEDHMDAIAKYYGVPSVSFRNALHQLVLQGRKGFKYQDLWVDAIHLTDRGHGFLAYVLIDYLAIVLELMRCSEVKGVLRLAAREQVLPAAPLFVHNTHRRGACSFGEGLSKQVVQMSNTWMWEDGEKAGYFTDAPGAEITLAIPSTAFDDVGDTEVTLEGGVQVRNRTGHIGIEQSWKKYGKVAIRCHGGCICRPPVVDLHTATSNATMQTVMDFPLQQLLNTSDPCSLTVITLAESTSGGHYVKLMSLGAE